MDMATRERGYGLIRAGVYGMRLTAVGSPLPPWPEMVSQAGAGCWVWNPTFGEQVETNGKSSVRL